MYVYDDQGRQYYVVSSVDNADSVSFGDILALVNVVYGKALWIEVVLSIDDQKEA